MAEKDNKDRRMLVETTGDFMFSDMSANQDVQPHRPSVVKPTTFIMQKADSKQLNVLERDWTGDSDEDFGKKWDKDPKAAYSKSGKAEAAVEAKKNGAKQISMNNLPRTGANPKTPDTIYNTPEGAATFDARTEGDGTDADKEREKRNK